MTPSERIKAITEISHRLAGQDWHIIDLCLGEFGVAGAESWGGTREEYVVDKLRAATDSAIMGLAEHVGVEVASERPQSPDPEFWNPGEFKLFISHTHDHARFVGELQGQLRRFAISAFVAHKDIEPSTEWLVAIQGALSTCDALAAVITPGFGSSKWTDQEVGFVLGRGKLVVPIARPDLPYGFLQGIQAVREHAGSPDHLAEELFERLRKNKQTRARIEQAVAEKLANSESFESARQNVALLRRLDRIGRDSAARVLAALDENWQLRGGELKGQPIPQIVREFIDSPSAQEARR